MRVTGGTRGPKPQKRIELYNSIKKDIFAGKYTERLPGVAKLAKLYNSSSASIQLVIHELANDNIVEIRPKSGTYIKNSTTKNRFAFVSLSGNNQELNMYNEFFKEYSPIEQGIKQCMEEAGENFSFKIFQSNELSKFEEFAKKQNRLIVLYPLILQKDVAKILDNKFYVRVMGVPNYLNNCSHVTYDNEEIGTIAASYLIKKNCQRFVCIGSDRLLLFKQRYESFASSLEFNNLSTEYLFVDKINMTPKEIHEKLSNFFSENIEDFKSGKLGIFCGADYFLLAIQQELGLLGLKFDNINIISCDNNPYFSKDIYPKCPSIDIRMFDIGYQAAKIALFSSENNIKEAIKPILNINEN